MLFIIILLFFINQAYRLDNLLYINLYLENNYQLNKFLEFKDLN